VQIQIASLAMQKVFVAQKRVLRALAGWKKVLEKPETSTQYMLEKKICNKNTLNSFQD